MPFRKRQSTQRRNVLANSPSRPRDSYAPGELELKTLDEVLYHSANGHFEGQPKPENLKIFDPNTQPKK